METEETEETEEGGRGGAEALARLCGNTAAVRALAEARGEGPEFERILAGLRADGDTAVLLAEAGELLRRCGAARGLGELRGTPVPPPSPAPWTGPPHGLPRLGGHAVEEAYVCPAGRCTRVVLTDEVGGGAPRDGDGPVCGILDRPLRPVRL